MGLIDFVSLLGTTILPYAPFYSVGLLVIGLFTTFWGFRGLKITQAIQGFISGFLIACFISFYVSIFTPNDVFVNGLWGGLICTALMLVSAKLARFLMGAFAGGLLTIAGELSIMASINPYVTLSGVALGGVLFIFIDDFVVAGAISIAGAWTTVTSIALLAGMGWFNPFQIILNPVDNLSRNISLLLGWVLISLAGGLVQLGVTRKKKKANATQQEAAFQPAPGQEEAPSLVAVKMDIGWDAPTKPIKKTSSVVQPEQTELQVESPQSAAPFTAPPEQTELETSPQQPPTPFTISPEQVDQQPTKPRLDPFFTDPFSTKEDVVDKKEEQPPAVSPFKQG